MVSGFESLIPMKTHLSFPVTCEDPLTTDPAIATIGVLLLPKKSFLHTELQYPSVVHLVPFVLNRTRTNSR